MSKISRRFRVVTLPQGHQESALATLREELVAAQANEDAAGRFGGKSQAVAKAKEFDKVLAEANADAVKVTVYALAYDEFGPLQDLHEPREDDVVDRRLGYNRKTFPAAVTRASLVEPESAKDLDDLIAKGDAAFSELGSLSFAHYAKLETAAWDVNVGDDTLPFISAVSVLKQARERDSEQPPASA